MKPYLITCYAILVKGGRWDLEPVEGSTKPVVPTNTDPKLDYRAAVAEYIAMQTVVA